MFTEEIEGMLREDNVKVLSILSQINPDKFRKNVLEIPENGISFFNSFYNKNSRLSSIKELLSLCESFGYSIMSNIKEYDKSFPVKNKNNPEFIPDFIITLSNTRNDDTVDFLIEKIGKEKIVELEKNGWPILELSYKKGLLKTIQRLSDYGCNIEVSPTGEKILATAEGDQRTLDLYWKIKNKKINEENESMSNEQFEHFFKLFKNKAKSIQSKKDRYTENVLNLVVQKQDVLTKEQKEKLLIISLGVVDLRLFKGIVKSLELKQNSKELKDLILPELANIKSQELLYLFLEDKDYLFKLVKKGFVKQENGSQYLISVDPLNDKYGIDMIIESLISLDVNPFEKYQTRGNKGAISQAIATRLSKLFENDNVLLEKMENGQTLFEKIALKKDYTNKLVSLLKIMPKNDKKKSLFNSITAQNIVDFEMGNFDFNLAQKQEIRSVLDKTWLNRDKDNTPFILKTKNEVLFDYASWILNYRLFQDNSESSIFNIQEKEKIFELLLNQVVSSWTKGMFSNVQNWDINIGKKNTNIEVNSIKVMKALYVELKNNPNTNWSNINIKYGNEEHLKDSEFLFEFNALKFSQQLSANLKEQVPIKNIKMKI